MMVEAVLISYRIAGAGGVTNSRWHQKKVTTQLMVEIRIYYTTVHGGENLFVHLLMVVLVKLLYCWR